MWKNSYAKEYLGQYYLHSEKLQKQPKCLWQIQLVSFPTAIPLLPQRTESQVCSGSKIESGLFEPNLGPSIPSYQRWGSDWTYDSG